MWNCWYCIRCQTYASSLFWPFACICLEIVEKLRSPARSFVWKLTKRDLSMRKRRLDLRGCVFIVLAFSRDNRHSTTTVAGRADVVTWNNTLTLSTLGCVRNMYAAPNVNGLARANVFDEGIKCLTTPPVCLCLTLKWVVALQVHPTTVCTCRHKSVYTVKAMSISSFTGETISNYKSEILPKNANQMYDHG